MYIHTSKSLSCQAPHASAACLQAALAYAAADSASWPRRFARLLVRSYALLVKALLVVRRLASQVFCTRSEKSGATGDSSLSPISSTKVGSGWHFNAYFSGGCQREGVEAPATASVRGSPTSPGAFLLRAGGSPACSLGRLGL